MLLRCTVKFDAVDVGNGDMTLDNPRTVQVKVTLDNMVEKFVVIPGIHV